jgi:hypothetical protein
MPARTTPLFRPNVLEIDGRFILLLPKLTTLQMGILERRLVALGYEVSRSHGIHAKKQGGRVFVSPSGYCLSQKDPTDAVGPVIPDLLSSRRQVGSPRSILSLYFRWKVQGPGGAFRFTPRVEAGGLWRELRKKDLCGLAPDEWIVFRKVLERSWSGCVLVTDFPAEGSVPFSVGSRTYFWSRLQTLRAAYAVRVIGERRDLNAYLPRSGIVSLDSFTPFSARDEWELASSLGEWCSFEPRRRERSNCGTPRGHAAPVV